MLYPGETQLPTWVTQTDYIMAETIMAEIMVWEAVCFWIGGPTPPHQTVLAAFVQFWPGANGWVVACLLVAAMHAVGILVSIFWRQHRRSSYVLRIPAVIFTSSFVLSLASVQMGINPVSLLAPIAVGLGQRGIWTLVRIGYLAGRPRP